MPPFAAIFALAANMNDRYSVSSGGRHDVPFNDDYASRGLEYFDVWSPEIATHYAEVFWTDMGTHPIPPEIVRRFANKTMAIVGYEMDQVMDNAGLIAVLLPALYSQLFYKIGQLFYFYSLN